jgi:hypothetical protein
MVTRPSFGILPGPGISERFILPRLANPEVQCGSTESTRAVMFVKAHKNVERFHAFIDEELDDIALLNFHRFVTFCRIKPKNPA